MSLVKWFLKIEKHVSSAFLQQWIIFEFGKANLIKPINKKFAGYQNSIQSKVMNNKNSMVYENVYKTSITNAFISNCYAGSLFGVITPNGDVFPCEILDEKYGNLRDYNYDLKIIWKTKNKKNFCKKIKDEKCFCTYECAWTFNILGNKKYHPGLVKSIF